MSADRSYEPVQVVSSAPTWSSRRSHPGRPMRTATTTATRVEVLAIAGEGNFVKLDWDFLLRHTGEQRRRPRPTIESQKFDAVDAKAHNGNDYLP
jgi:hypothetical protein